MAEMRPCLARTFSINLTGDVMLGRLIDQLRPTHVSNPQEAQYIRPFAISDPRLRSYSSKSPWGGTLSLFHSSNLNIINLETSVTTHSTPWPDKAFNYRMHPANIDFLREARIHYASLANNHSLDFCEEGLVETVETLEREGIKFAGAGRSNEEALRPARLMLKDNTRSSDSDAELADNYEVHVYSASDHPEEWSQVSGFHLIDYTSQTRDHLKKLLNAENIPKPSLKIFSVHWGPNYSWRPSRSIQDLAHFLVDECDVDIIHGHSSHHVQGVEVYKNKPIIYGCGDFVDDYAVDPAFRNNISALWRVVVGPKAEADVKLEVKKVEIYPTLCKRFITSRLQKNNPDYGWVKETLQRLSRTWGTKVAEEEGEDGYPKLMIAF